ncbi:hypothetical protein OM416_20225 [Paenibacillus sp. LS1]|uniref:hypothetical protein n=1 Tax=Paenibacillus sp. LS1 TaxID=2992120 RepID=UPI002230EA61|nr:hypothetical protein [Paenibacillus sp. LS1]MCW3793924.1 hypothetical protein [Paenibacillus sp. LS1]
MAVALVNLIFAKRLLEDSTEVQEKVIQDTSVSRISKTSVTQKLRLYDTLIQLLAFTAFGLGVLTLFQIYKFMFK